MGAGHTSVCRLSHIVLATALSLTAIADAKAFEVTAEQRAACTPDALRLCSSEIPDMGRIVACMEAKQASLSPQCRAVFQTASLGNSGSHRHAANRIASLRTSYRLAGSFRSRHHYVHAAVEVAMQYHQSRRFGWAGAGQGLFSSRTHPWMHSREESRALSMAHKIVVGYVMACQNHSIPDDLCNFSGSSSFSDAASYDRRENNSWGNFFGLSF